jgi:hypothetical protein
MKIAPEDARRITAAEVKNTRKAARCIWGKL